MAWLQWLRKNVGFQDFCFDFARGWAENSLDLNKDYDVIVFETTIRVVGGLLSFRGQCFLKSSRDIADRLLPAFNRPTGIPYNTINLVCGNAHNPGWTGGDSILADSGTEQLECIALSQRTGDQRYQLKAENVIAELNKLSLMMVCFRSILVLIEELDHTQTIAFGAMGGRY